MPLPTSELKVTCGRCSFLRLYSTLAVLVEQTVEGLRGAVCGTEVAATEVIDEAIMGRPVVLPSARAVVLPRGKTEEVLTLSVRSNRSIWAIVRVKVGFSTCGREPFRFPSRRNVSSVSVLPWDLK